MVFGNEYNQIGMEMFFINTDVQLFLSVSSCVTTYGKTSTVLDDATLDTILDKKPAFIVIDSYGIGAHGDQHLAFDKRCEEQNCFVVENVTLTSEIAKRLELLEIIIDKDQASTGKRCELTGLMRDE